MKRYYSRPSFITMGFQLHTGPLFAAMSIELQQDVGELFLAVNVQNRSNNGKYLFMHRIQAQFPIFSIGISEYNLVTRSP
ncbi:MAG TPA: hypothetical protein PK533_05765, partial [Rectinema sp.]|nr:hypothetical protein [Rectinema sp.]